jgi:O-antigen ligase
MSDRIQVNALLLVLCFASVLLLSAQSGASFSTYILAIAMIASFWAWNDVFRVPLFGGVCALLAYLVLTSFWSTPFEWRELFSTFSRALLVLVFVVAFAECQLRGQLRRWLGRTLAVSGSVVAFASIVVFIETDPVDGRLNGLGQLDNHIVAALVYGVVMIFVLDVLHREVSIFWRVISLISLVVILTAIYLSDSRNAWVSVLIGTGTFLLANRVVDRQRFLASMVSLALLTGVLIAALFVGEGTREIVLPRGDSFRLGIWAEMWVHINEAGWLTGLGILTPDSVVVDGLLFDHPHNMYMAILYQGGVVALLGFLGLSAWMIGVLLANYTHQDAKLALGVLAIALPSYVLDGHELIDKVGETWFLYWLPMAIAVGISWSSLTTRDL